MPSIPCDGCGGEVVDIHSVTRPIMVPDINFFATMLEFDNGATGPMVNSWTGEAHLRCGDARSWHLRRGGT